MFFEVPFRLNWERKPHKQRLPGLWEKRPCVVSANKLCQPWDERRKVLARGAGYT
jgi:hypothetical protein